VSAAVEFIATLGTGNSLRGKLIDAYKKICAHEHSLASKLYNGLKQIEGVTLVGQDFSSTARTPTLSFTVKGKNPTQVCEQLAHKNIFAWDGHFYAIRAIEALGLLEKGGVTRMGISVYNTSEEIDLTMNEVMKIAGQ
jgi:selenocysteine lyase/cysteine desulfurase